MIATRCSSLQHLVGREGNGEAIEQVVAHRPLLGVVGGDQQAAAGVGEAEALALDPVLAAAHRRQQQVGDAVVEQVELIDVEHAPVGFGQQAGLEHRRCRLAREAVTSTEPTSRSSVTPRGTCTKGAGITAVGSSAVGSAPLGSAPSW